MKPYILLDKKVGETPLVTAEKYRKEHPELEGVPMAYAGRLDPMASGKLLVLLGEECKIQEKYHDLDKEYIFEVLFGVGSDTGDVLGLLQYAQTPNITKAKLKRAAADLIGEVELPYPHFSSKTVHGKPLHVWTLEGRLDEIEIPTKRSSIYALELVELREQSAQEIYTYATQKIETIPLVTQESKALGNDFRRTDVRASWKTFIEEHDSNTIFYVARFVCVASSGTYMRTLASVIAGKFGTKGLAYSIERTKIGIYTKIFRQIGFWRKIFT